ncbi:MAG TPA: tRNA pseudouridine(38-40) synthase TruA [Smithellaceae bacterium]|nr:tRNA pseudouridine(38-40) synthase TruA [Smithellaceae bacterium]HRS88119.1 tRNA pseudouridine(38-40) synthase TruA [Smithellaceae bacterium]HRV25407.1 tRNA pseudouridine(38-40) synthase TruA [Smithellaceae bacterium]
MPKYKLVLEYDGTNYRGWQAQKNARSVQGTLIKIAGDIFGKPLDVQGAGRTDAGVHALAQVAHLDINRKINPETLRMNLNDALPASINILSVKNVPLRFHARHDAVSRSYLYLIALRRTAFGKRYVWWVKDRLDFDRMRQALGVFHGFHDFSSFADKRMDKNVSTQVNVEKVEIIKAEGMIALRIVASHFLWKMVRRIVGVTVEAGRGNLSRSRVENLLASHSEMPAHFTAPPSGLFLERVLYAGDRLPEMKLPLRLL